MLFTYLSNILNIAYNGNLIFNEYDTRVNCLHLTNIQHSKFVFTVLQNPFCVLVLMLQFFLVNI